MARAYDSSRAPLPARLRATCEKVRIQWHRLVAHLDRPLQVFFNQYKHTSQPRSWQRRLRASAHNVVSAQSFFCKLTAKLPLFQVCVGSFGPIIHGRLNSKTPAVPLPLCSFLSPQMLHHARASKQ